MMKLCEGSYHRHICIALHFLCCGPCVAACVSVLLRVLFVWRAFSARRSMLTGAHCAKVVFCLRLCPARCSATSAHRNQNAHVHQHVAVAFSALATLPYFPLLASMGKTYESRCKECNKCFYSATSEKSARSCRDRHFREAHTCGAQRWRRACNGRRQVVA